MPARAKDGTCLAALVKMVVPICKAAQRQCHRAGSGRPPTFKDWQIAMLILIAVLNRRKSKSAQYQFLDERRQTLQAWLALEGFPARSTYFERYRVAHRLLEQAVAVQGRRALAEGIADPASVAVDKSLIAARGPVLHRRHQRSGKRVRGADRQAGWGYSDHDGWVYGYGFETVVTATAGSLVFPLLASAGPANQSEHRSFRSKILRLPAKTRYVLADRGYDSNAHQEAVEKCQRPPHRAPLSLPSHQTRRQIASGAIPASGAERARMPTPAGPPEPHAKHQRPAPLQAPQQEH